MKAKSKVYDPDLGNKFLCDYGTVVIGRGKSSKQRSIDEPSKYQDAQESHDEQMPDLLPHPPHQRTQQDCQLHEELTHLAVSDPTLARMLKMKRPLNRETWLEMNYPDRTIDSLSAEELADVPAPFQEASKPMRTLPDAPKREQFLTDDEFEEAKAGWMHRVGRIKAMGLKKNRGNRGASPE